MRLKGTQFVVIDVKLHWHHNSKVSQPALCLVDVMHQLAVKESLKLTRIYLLSQQISVVHSDICYLWSQQSFLAGNQLWPILVIFTNPFLCDTFAWSIDINQIQAHFCVIHDRSLCNCKDDLLPKTHLHGYWHSSIWFNLNRIERWPINRVAEYRDFRLTT